MNLQTQRWFLVGICLVTFFVNNDVFVPDIMESRNIVTAKEMVEEGHWLIPTMNGELRLEKPPLPTWVTALGYEAWGENITLLRALAGMMGCFLAYFFYRFVERVLRRDAMMATLILLTCYNVVLMGRTASWDIYCHAFMMGAIYWFAEGFLRPGPQWGRFLGAGAMLGLSFMSKGPVSFYGLFLPFLLLFCYTWRPKGTGKWGAVAAMATVAVILSAWWYAWIYAFHPEATESVVGKESANWVSYNVRPWWYYWKFFLESGIWAVLLLTAITYPLFKWKKKLDKAFLFSLGWMFLSLILLSCLPEKKSRYLFPLLVPAAMLMGILVDDWIRLAREKRLAGVDRGLWITNDVLLAAVALGLPVAAFFMMYLKGWMSIWVWCAVAVCSFACAGYLVTSVTRVAPARMVWGVAFLFCSLELFGLPSAKWMINNPEMHSLRATRTIAALQDVPFYYVPSDELRIELVYAAGRKIRPLPVDMDSAIVADSVMARMPMAVLTHGYVGDELPAALWAQVDTIDMGTYDDNRRPKGNKRYSPIFVYRLTMLKKK